MPTNYSFWMVGVLPITVAALLWLVVLLDVAAPLGLMLGG